LRNCAVCNSLSRCAAASSRFNPSLRNTLLVECATNFGVACSRFLPDGRGLLREGGRLLPLLLERACAIRRRILQLGVSNFGLLCLHEVRRGKSIILFGLEMLWTSQRDSRR
jgi:hypothetical protein